MKPSYTALLLILLAEHAISQHEPAPPAQELEPVSNALSDHTPDYQTRMRKVLFNRAEWGNEFQFLRMPSFHPETLLTVRKKGDHFVGQVLRPEKQIWYYKGDDAEIKVTEKEKSLPTPLVERASNLWQTMLLRTKFQRRSMVLDGISYTFLGYAPGYSRLTAESSNPERDTKPDMLARIGELLMMYVEAQADEEPDIQKRMVELMDRLENALNTLRKDVVSP